MKIPRNEKYRFELEHSITSMAFGVLNNNIPYSLLVAPLFLYRLEEIQAFPHRHDPPVLSSNLATETKAKIQSNYVFSALIGTLAENANAYKLN